MPSFTTKHNPPENYISSCDFWIFVSVFYALLIWLSFFSLLFFFVGIKIHDMYTVFLCSMLWDIGSICEKEKEEAGKKNTLNENIRFKKHNNNRLHYRTTYITTHTQKYIKKGREKHKVIDKIHKLHSFSVCLCLRFPSIWNNTIPTIYVYHTLSIFNFPSLWNVHKYKGTYRYIF